MLVSIYLLQNKNFKIKKTNKTLIPESQPQICELTAWRAACGAETVEVSLLILTHSKAGKPECSVSGLESGTRPAGH